MVAPAASRPHVLDLLAKYGRTTTSFQILEPGLEYWFSDDRDACVAFRDTGRAWVVAGAPVCAADRDLEMFRHFGAAASGAKRRVRYFGVERDRSAALGLRHVNVGEQPVWNPQDWAEALRGRRSLREQLRRARAKGVRIHRVPTEDLADPASADRRRIDALIEAWLASRAMPPMGFLVQVDLYRHAEERRLFVAERDGSAVGLLSAVPIYARNGWFFEDALRAPTAPNGTVELLFDHAMRVIAAEGSRHVTYGLAPLANTKDRWLRLIRDHSRWLYDFEGLRRFKAKFQPASWQPVYLAYPTEERGPLALYDVLAAFGRGSCWRFGAATVAHRMGAPAEMLTSMLGG